jgi:hypothetical protein
LRETDRRASATYVITPMDSAGVSTETTNAAGAIHLPGSITGAHGVASHVVSAKVNSILHWVFSFPAMLAMFLTARVFYEARIFFVDPDVWWHIKVGQDILVTHHFPESDPFSWTVSGSPWIAYEWLGDVLIGGVAKYAGFVGLATLLFVMASAVTLAIYTYATMRSGNCKAGFVSALVLCSLAFASFTLRPQMIGYLLLVLLLIALERFQQGKMGSLWLAPPLFLIWVNTHGSFIIGLGVIVVHWAMGLSYVNLGGIETKKWTPQQRIRLELIFLLCLAALPFTPYGVRLAIYPFDMAFSQPVNVANILEWQPMPFNVLGAKLFLALLVIFFFAQMVIRPVWRAAEVLLFFVGVVMACLHVRFVLLFVPFFAPMFAMLLARWFPVYQRKRDHYILNAAMILGLMGAIAYYFPKSADIHRAIAKEFPVTAVAYLGQHPAPRPTFNTYNFGGYLVYSDQKVFIDGRGDLFEREGVFSDYLQASLIRTGALQVLDRYGVQSCLLQRGEPLTVVLAASPNWERVYHDNVSELFIRR